MAMRGRTVAGAAVLVCAAVAFGSWSLFRSTPSVPATGSAPAAAEREATGAEEAPVETGGEVAAADSPFSTVVPAAGGPADVATAPATVVDEVAAPGSDTGFGGAPVDLASLGREPLSDDDFERLAARLARDPALLQALVDEARSETDPVRLERLLRLLGDVDDPAVAALAAELVYSGDATSRELGLDLLKRVRPGDADAQAVVSGLLSTETEGRVLVPALTALARPGNTPPSGRAALAGQVALLTEHADPAVRRTSVDILSRWSDDGTWTPQLVSALSDTDAGVRRAAAFAFVGYPDESEPVRRGLFDVADDASADEGTRRGALLALTRMALGDDERARADTIERRLDTRPATP